MTNKPKSTPGGNADVVIEYRQPKKGRPPLETARRNRLTIRLDDEAWAQLFRLAMAQGLSTRTLAASIISDSMLASVVKHD